MTPHVELDSAAAADSAATTPGAANGEQSLVLSPIANSSARSTPFTMAQNNPLMFSGSAADMLKSMVRQKFPRATPRF